MSYPFQPINYFKLQSRPIAVMDYRMVSSNRQRDPASRLRLCVDCASKGNVGRWNRFIGWLHVRRIIGLLGRNDVSRGATRTSTSRRHSSIWRAQQRRRISAIARDPAPTPSRRPQWPATTTSSCYSDSRQLTMGLVLLVELKKPRGEPRPASGSSSARRKEASWSAF